MATTQVDEPASGAPRKRAPRKKRTFTELSLRKLKPPKVGQTLYWDGGDRGQLGLSVLVSAGGTKTFRSTFYLHGTRYDRKLGRVGEMELAQARDLTGEDRKQAAQGIDPRRASQADTDSQQANDNKTLAHVVEQFLTHYAKPRQRTWDQTERILKSGCAPLLKRPIAEITKQELRTLLRGFIAEGHPHKARVTRAWLKKLFRWAAEEDYVTAPVMEAVRIDFEQHERTRVYSDAEIAACWNAAAQLPAGESSYVKLLLLLAPRKTALACLQRTHLDDPDNPTLWTTPHELTKSKKSLTKKRQYKTPLPPLAARILKGVLRSDSDLVFPMLPTWITPAGQRRFNSKRLIRRLVEHGAPADFTFHTWRHTLATFLENAGHSEWSAGWCSIIPAAPSPLVTHTGARPT